MIMRLPDCLRRQILSSGAVCACGWTTGPMYGSLSRCIVDFRWWLHRKRCPW